VSAADIADAARASARTSPTARAGAAADSPSAVQGEPAPGMGGRAAHRGWWARVRRGQPGEAALWVALVVALTGATALLIGSGAHYGPRSSRGFTDGTLPLAWPPRLTALTAIAPALAAGVLGGVALLPRLRADRPAPPFWFLIVLSYLGTVAWWLALGAASRGGLRVPVRLLPAAHTRLSDLLASPTGTPPGPRLLAWTLGGLGVHGATPVGLTFTMLGALAVPFLAIAVRSLCHEPAARRLLPVLVLAPWAPFAVAAPDAVTTAVAAAAVAVGVVGCERGRRVRWAFGAGLLLGLAALFAYPVIWLGVAIAAAYFVRRRPLLNVFTGAGALVPLFALRLAGYSWPQDLSRAGGDLFGHASLTWLVPDLLAALLCCGPVLVRAARRLTMTPGWPFLVGAAAAALFAVVDGLAAGGTQESWLPLFGWLVVPALAPRPRPAGPGDTSSAGQIPYGLVSVGALLAVVLAALVNPA
jgi:hypothetical protein